MERPHFHTDYPSTEHLKKRAERRIPKFAFEYLIGGANEEYNLRRNHEDIQDILMMPEYIKRLPEVAINTHLFGRTYQAPFGVAPIGLQGLIWPNAPEILAKTAVSKGLPFILSTVTTSSVERVAEITNGDFWFQLYHPAEKEVKDDLLKRLQDKGCEVLVALADTPSFGIRYKDIRNGLSMPPKLSVRNMLQIVGKPKWALQTLIYGKPQFESLKAYMPKGLNLSQLGKFMNNTFDGRLTEEKLKVLRDQWKGKLVIKGVVNELDAEKAYALGADGIIVSNHGGRQLDAGESSIKSLRRLIGEFNDRLTIMMDGGVQSGPDIARCLASGAKFCFLGRSWMYGVGALGNRGGDHVADMLKMQLTQVMQQLGCQSISELSNHLINEESQ